MKRPLPPAQLVSADVLHHRETERGENDRKHDRSQYDRVGLVAHHAVGKAGEAGIVEGADRMEHPVPYGGRDRHAVRDGEAGRQHQGDGGFDVDGDLEDQLEHGCSVARFEPVAFHLCRHAIAQPEAAPDHQSEQGRCCHDAEPADLEQDHYHTLAEKRPVDGRVLYDEAGNGNCRGSGKEGREQRRPRSVRGRKGQAQYGGANDDEPEKKHRDQSNRIAKAKHGGRPCSHLSNQ